ncbi:TonB-dependent receptor [Novimethylophilus kurashikiensis]|uniref:TonB-dependent receptor n=1 Tax=Novimethylophilus kurashikiensis TaxID=1825523 RepID=A0A2R5FFP3_9PROT|nr:transporter [Novimethylophilus kurashikiensis]GBG15423.1 TonB-dependent receptor [Novimethylophilus kurashikiensis]
MKSRLLPAAVMLAVSTPVFAHCGGAFCTLNTNWDTQGVWDKPGVRIDLRAEYIDLDQLREGTHKTGPAGVVDTHDEVRTLNRNFIGTLDYSFSPEWGVSLRVPLMNRYHNHIFNNAAGPESETWRFTEIGDIQAVARYAFYQGMNDTAGVRFGLKLPTGSISQSNGSEKAERSLQPGTGSTDGVLGLYYNRREGAANWFVQGTWQQVIHERDDFRPGRQLALDAGVSYAATPDWSLMLQVNAQHKSRDSGANAEAEDSGGRYVFLTPGVSYKASKDIQVYGFIQKPIYQDVNGVQLTADWSAAMGVSMQF